MLLGAPGQPMAGAATWAPPVVSVNPHPTFNQYANHDWARRVRLQEMFRWAVLTTIYRSRISTRLDHIKRVLVPQRKAEIAAEKEAALKAAMERDQRSPPRSPVVGARRPKDGEGGEAQLGFDQGTTTTTTTDRGGEEWGEERRGEEGNEGQ